MEPRSGVGAGGRGPAPQIEIVNHNHVTNVVPPPRIELNVIEAPHIERTDVENPFQVGRTTIKARRRTRRSASPRRSGCPFAPRAPSTAGYPNQGPRSPIGSAGPA